MELVQKVVTVPLLLQMKHRIEDMILSERLAANEQAPSSTQMVKFYHCPFPGTTK